MAIDLYRYVILHISRGDSMTSLGSTIVVTQPPVRTLFTMALARYPVVIE